MRPQRALGNARGQFDLGNRLNFFPSGLLLKLYILTLKRSFLEFDEEQEYTSISCPLGGWALSSMLEPITGMMAAPALRFQCPFGNSQKKASGQKEAHDGKAPRLDKHRALGKGGRRA